MFITFEGPDGSGKTTALKKLKQYLDEQNIEYVFTREPGGSGSETAQKIRKIILDPKNKITNMSEALLYSADRRMNLEQNIWPALNENKLVLCDRFIDSTFAYQGFARGLGFDQMIALQDVVTEKTYPDLTIFFDIKPVDSSQRLKQRTENLVLDRLESAGGDFHEKVYEGYQEIIKKFSKRIKVVDASKPKEDVFNQVKNIFIEAYKK